MWLVDTSVWIDHFRHGKPLMAERLAEGLVLIHPGVLGELACGSLRHRSKIFYSLKLLPTVAPATDAEVLHFVGERKLWGRGIGWIDAHLLASALLFRCRLWTLDKRLAQAGEDLNIC